MMFKRLKFVLAIIMFCGLSGHAQAQDQIYLTNGDRLSGTISAYGQGVVTIETRYGVFDIPFEEIHGTSANTLKAALKTPLFEEKSIPQGPVETLPSTPTETIPDPVQAGVMADPVVVTTEEETPKWLGAEWSGNINAGASLERGNSDTESLNLDAESVARWNDNRLRINADYNRAKENGTLSEDDKSLKAAYDHFLNTKLFWENALEISQDEIDQIDLRLIYSTGLGYQFYERDDLSLSTVAGVGYLREKFENGETDSAFTLNWSSDYQQKFYDDFFRLFHSNDINTPADDLSAFLFQSESGVKVPLRKGIVASGQVDFDWDNDPAPETTEEDVNYILKLGYEW